jgi:hypothetical protein
MSATTTGTDPITGDNRLAETRHVALAEQYPFMQRDGLDKPC